jgi:hypothetical protein
MSELVGTVPLAKNLIFDYNSTLVAHLYRMGSFGPDVTAEDPWKKDIPELLHKNQPLFRTHPQAGAD